MKGEDRRLGRRGGWSGVGGERPDKGDDSNQIATMCLTFWAFTSIIWQLVGETSTT